MQSSTLQTASTHHKDGRRYYQIQSCASVSFPSHFIGAILHFAAHSFFVRMISRFCVKEMETPLGERNVIASAKEHTLVFPVRWFNAKRISFDFLFVCMRLRCYTAMYVICDAQYFVLYQNDLGSIDCWNCEVPNPFLANTFFGNFRATWRKERGKQEER